MKYASSLLEKLPVCGACYAVVFEGAHVFIEVEGVLANPHGTLSPRPVNEGAEATKPRC